MSSRIALTPHELVVFISSTYVDLEPYRDKVEETLTRIESNFRSMKFWGSSEGEPLEQCLKKLRECNYYVAVIGHRYGAVHPERRFSYTELEYEEAKSLGISRRIYLASNAVLVKPEHIESDESRKQLDSFRQKLKKENKVVFFSYPEDLATRVVSDILLNLTEKPSIESFAKKKYLPAIRSLCSSISFLGLDIQALKRHMDVQLEKVYVRSKFAAVGTPGTPGVSPDIAGSDLTARGRLEGDNSLPLSDVLSRSRRIVVLGDPGSGKTTLAKYLVTALVDNLAEITDFSRARLPIRVPLRPYAEYRQRSFGVGATILEFASAHARTELQLDSIPEGFFEFYLSRREALVVFDGLDEIFDAHLREQVRNDIVSFARVSYPGNHVIVTSRKVGYDEVGFPQPFFKHFEVRPFDDKQVSEYIRKWYRLEEGDRRKREVELAALEKARGNLPKELLSNPLLLSLIVILFRSGCTLPESKLEIYRSCVGTLTEKWDAAGKRIEFPEKYNLVRDKKNAFARIAYWMYGQQSEPDRSRARAKYPEVLAELAAYLCEREFKGRETEAEQAAEAFLEYAAKRSIFVEDRFSHKTFHEYFAALYLYRNFCLGRSIEELYRQIEPYLKSDYWAVVLELFLLMLDEQSGQVLDLLLEKLIADVTASPEGNYGLLLVPLRTLGQLQNIGQDKVQQVVSTAIKICVKAKVSDPWAPRAPEEAAHQRVFAALENLPTILYPSVTDELRRCAQEASSPEDIVPAVAFHYEFPRPLGTSIDEMVPNWGTLGQQLAGRHLSIFYVVYPSFSTPFSSWLAKFIQNFGKDHLSHEQSLIFRANYHYIPFAEYCLAAAMGADHVQGYDDLVEKMLGTEFLDLVLPDLVARSQDKDVSLHGNLELVADHFRENWTEPRKYLVDSLIMVRALRHPLLSQAAKRHNHRVLNSLRKSGNRVQKFYSGLLLQKKPPIVSAEELRVSHVVFPALHLALAGRG